MTARPDEATVPPCASCPTLFESENPADHQRAKKLCDTCPLIAACETNLADTIATYGYTVHTGPRGTWAGQLLAPKQPAAKTRAVA